LRIAADHLPAIVLRDLRNPSGKSCTLPETTGAFSPINNA